MSLNLKVLEEFVTVQGTGRMTGLRQYFIRAVGCSVKDCPIRSKCDEPEALNESHGEWRKPEDLVLAAYHEVGRGGWIHVTGGEPFDQMDAVEELGKVAKHHGMLVHYQTSGAHRIEMPCDWLTVSPKSRAEDLAQCAGGEMVLVDDDVSYETMRSLQRSTKFWYYYLMPLEGGDPQATIDKVHHVNKCGMPWLFTDQMHKRWGVR